MKALVGAFNQEKALVGAFSVIVKTGYGTDGSICGTSCNCGLVPGEVLAMSLMMGASPSCSRISSLFSCVRALSAMAPTMLVSTWSLSTLTLAPPSPRDHL